MAAFSGHWSLAFGVLGNVVSFLVFLAPIPTFHQIYKKKSSEGFQSIPYVVALFSAVLWIYYALLKCNATFLITINSVGCFIETFYIIFYFYYASKKSKLTTMKLLGLIAVLGMGIFCVTHFLMRPSQRPIVVGWICLVFSLCVFVAPLCILRQVVRTKNVEHMPFLLSVFLTISAVMWFFYGLLLKDYNIAIPNILGFIFGLLQMALYARYRNTDKMTEQKIPEAGKQRSVLEEEKNPNHKIIEVFKLSEMLSSHKNGVEEAKPQTQA
ncbi:bidirectional sugar transporter SWEET14-like [Salvia hispanica]|uniref:bidirectional sugar transporter SWEET14-like n=1 Tax=Salvia hispanica TaxID=49212 RepID=UPI0020095717|nr:bidirectional sugar transporter SWEET14-like [Salvia hispanica]